MKICIEFSVRKNHQQIVWSDYSILWELTWFNTCSHYGEQCFASKNFYMYFGWCRVFFTAAFKHEIIEKLLIILVIHLLANEQHSYFIFLLSSHLKQKLIKLHQVHCWKPLTNLRLISDKIQLLNTIFVHIRCLGRNLIRSAYGLDLIYSE